MASIDQVAGWLTLYVGIWRAGEHSRVPELFTEDALYFTDPFRPPKRGHAEIGDYWRESGDPPDGFEAVYEALAVEGDLAVVTGFSRYLNERRTGVDKEYGNVFVMRLAPDGRCREYREWYMLRAGAQPAQ